MAIITRGELQDIHYSFYEKRSKIITQAVAAYLKAVEKVGLSDVIMVTPMKNKEGVTVVTFNKIIQEKIITDRDKVVQTKMNSFYIKDKIIQRENDYSGKAVINGEMGFVKDILEDRFVITYPDRDVEYPNDDAKQIELAYCISGHKYQGSQAKIVIVVLDTSHYVMLSKQWLYTSVTRGIEIDYIIAHPKAFAMAIATNHAERKTFMQHIIKENRKN